MISPRPDTQDLWKFPSIKLFNYKRGKTVFDYTEEIRNCIYSLENTNIIAKSQNKYLDIDSGILYQAIQHLLDETPFSDNQLHIYFKTQLSVEEFHRTLEDSIQISLEAYLPYPVDFHLLGLGLTTYTGLATNSRIILHQQYEILFWELFQKELTVQEFIVSAKKLLKTFYPAS